MKTWFKWIVIGTLVVLMMAGVMRSLAARKVQAEALQTQQAAQKTNTPIDLQSTDVALATTIELSQGLPISGTIKAVNSAVIKARVPGELQGLLVREGDFVKAGQIVARIDDTEAKARLRQAQQQAQSAKAQVDIAKRSFDNNRSLVEQGFISKTALDTSTASLNAAEANHLAAQAGADVASKALEDTVLRSPISGQVAQRLAQPGERVGVDARILEIVDISTLELEANLGAADSIGVKVGQTATLTLEGIAQSVTLGQRAEVAGQTMVAVNGIAENTTVLLGTAGALREGTPVRPFTNAK
jgi:RND family efflux transporter MFP subunit